MTHRSDPRFTIHLPLMCLLVLVLASPAYAEWKEKVLYSFQGLPDGNYPSGGVVFDKAGNIYGVTTEGGSGACAPAQCGIVYQLSPPKQEGGAWTETVLYVFKGQKYGDGSSPAGTLLIDSSGNLYGGTGYGGTGDCMLLGGAVGCGTVYELSPPKQKGGAWTEKVLYSFKGGKDGQLAGETLTFDSLGNLYGATYFGGGFGSCDAPYYLYCGTIYKLTPPKMTGGRWSERVLHSFRGVVADEQLGDGAGPNGELVLDNKGAIYGTTYIGGYNCPHNSNLGCGAVFRLAPPEKKGGKWTEEIMHRFKLSTEGRNPAAGMIFDGRGYLYGTSDIVAFRMTPPKGGTGSWKLTILSTMNNDAYDPEGSLIFDVNGDLYGTTEDSQTSSGTVFKLESRDWRFSILYGFKGGSNGASPDGPVVFDKLGNLYGTTFHGGTGDACEGYCGTVFEVSP
jgi:hypothetical protein